MAVQTFRRRPTQVLGLCWTGTAESTAEVREFIGDAHLFTQIGHSRAQIWVRNRWVPILAGEYVMRDALGDFYPCAQDVLELTYDEETDS